MENQLVDGVQSNIVLDPRIGTPSPFYNIKKSATHVNYFTNTSQSYSDTSVIFSVVPPSKDVYVDKKIEMNFGVEFTMNVTNNTGGNATFFTLVSGSATNPVFANSYKGAGTYLGIAQTGEDAVAFYPIQSRCCSAATLMINQQSFQLNLKDYLEPLMRYGYDNTRDVNKWLSTGPAKHDMFTKFSDWTKFGNNVNPLGAYGQDETLDRGAHIVYVLENPVIADGASGQVKCFVRWSERLMVSPLDVSSDLTQGLIGVNNLTINLSLDNLGKCWSHDADSSQFSINTISGTFSEAPVARFLYLTPCLLARASLSNIYPYYSIERYITGVQATAPAGQGGLQVTSNNIQLSSVPKRFFVILKPKYTSVPSQVERPDFYGYLENLNISFNNQSGLLSSASAQDLYQIACKNGFSGSWIQWRFFSGSPMCIDLSQDLSQSELTCVGLQSQINLQVTATYQNLSEEAVNYELHLVVISEGSVSITGTECSRRVGSVSAANLLANQDNVDVLAINESTDFYGGAIGMYGAGFWDTLKKVGRKVYHGVQKAMPYVKQGVNLVEKYGPAAAMMLGIGKRESLGGTSMAGGLQSTEVPSGGRKLNRSALQRRM